MKKQTGQNAPGPAWVPLLCFGLSLVCFLLFGGLMIRGVLGGGQPAPPIQSQSPAASAAAAPTPDPWALNEQGVLNKYAPYYAQNPELIGWLSIEGTTIDYPVMYTPGQNEKYLRRGFDGLYSEGGCLFLDERCSTAAPTANLMIYGHDMNDGSMFGRLIDYAEADYGRQHSRIRFDTLQQQGEYQLLAAFYTQVYYTTDECFKYYQFFDAENRQQFDDYIAGVKALAEYDTGVEAVYGDTLLTLSTCSKHTENGRFVVVAKKVG